MARTVAGNTITQALIDEQNSSGRVPYIKVYIAGEDWQASTAYSVGKKVGPTTENNHRYKCTTAGTSDASEPSWGTVSDGTTSDGTVTWTEDGNPDYTSRLEYLEHHEEAYRDRNIVGLNNRDNALDDVDLDGCEFEIAYGYVTGNAVAEPLGNDDTAEYTYTATLWVKSHQIISHEGERIYQIYAEGMWMRLREQKVIAGVTGNQDVLYSNTFDTYTVYGLIELVIEGAMSWTLNALPATDDGIIDDFKPVFEVNQMPFEMAAALLYRLIWMTKCFIRAKKGKTFEIVYPQTSDTVDETYYSDKAHWFIEYVEKTILLIPNSIAVLCNQDPNTGEWDTDAYPLIVGTASDATQIAKYAEILQPFLAGSIRKGDDADNRAEAVLSKFKSEILGGRLVIPHDSRVELYDKVEVQDQRGH